MSYKVDPRRGEIWWVDLEPAKGSEMKKTRPAVVVSSDAIGRIDLRIIVPLINWTGAYSMSPWFVKLSPTNRNGLKKECGADCCQVRAVSIGRFASRLGAVAATELDKILAGIALSIDYVPGE
ncbi:MAG: type II toxin-antitoxin system PemK/MazF family toxin [Planctomycetota bacterium]|jgi:mRNA interferase MazF